MKRLVKAIALLTPLILIAGNCDRLSAQIIPDESLGDETSRVTPNVEIKGSPAELINGGALRETNLFHSFEQFNVDNGQRVYFANPTGVENIFSRVTGSNLSEIMGTLGVNGNADLFLINPNGIVFGENASLDVNGSFVGSTADAIQFGDRGFFSATEPETPPLLTIKPSAFFFNQINPGTIVNRSVTPVGEDLTATSLFGLQVPNGQNLVLAGGEITIDGGGIQALGGQVELVGIADSAKVDLKLEGNRISLIVPEEIERGNITLQNGAIVNVAADDGGDIAIKARNLEIVDSSLVAGIDEGLGTEASQAGNISLEATETITVAGSSIFNSVNSEATGTGGDLQIAANSLLIEDFSFLNADTFGAGDAGKVLVQVNDSVTLTDGSTIFNTVRSEAIGDASGVTIEANSFSLLEGAEIQAGNKGGEGNAGNVTVEVGGGVFFDGLFSDGFASGIFTGVDSEGVGTAGDIKITANSLTISDGARLQTKSEGQGNSGDVIIDVQQEILFDGAEENPQPEFQHITGIFTTVETETFQLGGNIQINTGSLKIINGAEITANTFGIGDVGSITIEAKDSITLNGNNERGSISGIFSTVGRDPQGAIGIGQGGDIQLVANSLSITNGAKIAAATQGEGNAGKVDILVKGQVFLDGKGSEIATSVTAKAIGDGNDIDLTTERLTISNEARLNASALGDGEAGNIEVNSNSLNLQDRASISAETRSGNGGDITLKTQELLLLRRSSKISTTAGNEQFGGDGGNITIDTPLLVTFPQENSDITANAFTGKGGNININTQNIFGFKANPSLSNITASSQFGLDGTVNINTSGIEPGQESIELPLDIVDVSKLINQNLCLADGEGEFIITGQGGLSPSPQDTLNTDTGWEDWRMVENGEFDQQQSSPKDNTNIHKDISLIEEQDRDSHKIVEAQSWFVAPNGNIVLSAQPVKSVSKSFSWHPFNCQSLGELQP